MRAGTRRGARWLAGVWAVAVVLAAVVMAGPAQAATSPFTYSTVAWTGTSAIIAGTNSAGDLYYWSELITSSTFNEQLLASGQHFTGAPAIGWTGSTVIIAVSQGSQLDYWYEQYGTSTWHEQQVSTGVYGADYNTSFGPSIGWTGSKVIISSTDNFGGVDYFFQNAGTRTWYGQLVEPGIIPPWRGTAIGWTGSSVIITSWDQYGQLAYFSDPAGTGTWHGQTVAKDIYADPAIAWTGKSVVITDTSPQGDLEIWRQAAGARTWSNKQIAPALGAKHYFGPRHLANPSIAVAGGFVIITAVDSSGNLDYWSQFGPTPWNEQQVAAG